MAPRGLSAEEKRVKLLEIFHESKDFYQLKELEKLGPKLKGIVSQSIKEVLQSLVDDGLVQGDKIGSSNFFWSFPSQNGTQARNRLDKAKEARDTNRAQLVEMRASLEAEKTIRPQSVERTAALDRLTALRKQLLTLENELEQYGACDPVKIEEKRRAVVLAHEAAVRWTDNYSVLVSYFTRQFGIDSSDIHKEFSIPENYEDIA